MVNYTGFNAGNTDVILLKRGRIHTCLSACTFMSLPTDPARKKPYVKRYREKFPIML